MGDIVLCGEIDNGSSYYITNQECCQSIIWTNALILLIEYLGINFSEIW